MIRDRKELELHLLNSIENVKYNRRIINQINKDLSNHVPMGFFSELTKNPDTVKEIELSLLIVVTIAVFNTTGDMSIRPEDYFTDNEINEAKKVSIIENEDIKLPIVLSNVLQLDHENYVTTIDIAEPVKWERSKLLVYDFETQRSPKFKKTNNGVVPIPELNKESVKAISESMENKTYLPDMITLNVYSDEIDPIIYNPKTKQLTIKEGATLSILDGYHRLMAASTVYSMNDDFHQPMILSIKVYDTDTAKKYFGQINTINVVSKQRLDELKQEKISFISVKQLQMNSDLKGRIASGARISEVAGQLTTADILATAIEETFDPSNMFEAKEIGIYLAEFFNYLVGMFPDEFMNNPNKYKEESFINHQRMFVGYIVFSKKFKDNGIALNKIKDLINSLDLSVNNAELSSLLTDNRGNSPRMLKKIVEYFNNIDINKILKMGA